MKPILMKRLIETVRKGMRMFDVRQARARQWKPVLEESPTRRLSAPSHGLCAVSDIGRHRRNNEDGYFLSRDRRLWIVADGMGGHAAGEVASALSIEGIADSIDAARSGSAAGAGADCGDLLMLAFADAQERVSSRSRWDDACRGMGATAVAGFVDGEALHVCHVGDARGYHLSGGHLRRLTNDHSLVWELVKSGMLKPDQARSHPQRGKITQAIGMDAAIKPEVTSLVLKPADRVLLCSDGLWEALADQELGKLLGSDGSMMELATILVDRANNASGQDNITAVLYERGGTGGRAAGRE
jgi:protein phosphatase